MGSPQVPSGDERRPASHGTADVWLRPKNGHRDRRWRDRLRWS